MVHQGLRVEEQDLQAKFGLSDTQTVGGTSSCSHPEKHSGSNAFNNLHMWNFPHYRILKKIYGESVGQRLSG